MVARIDNQSPVLSMYRCTTIRNTSSSRVPERPSGDAVYMSSLYHTMPLVSSPFPRRCQHGRRGVTNHMTPESAYHTHIRTIVKVHNACKTFTQPVAGAKTYATEQRHGPFKRPAQDEVGRKPERGSKRFGRRSAHRPLRRSTTYF